jgi:Alginate lyase
MTGDAWSRREFCSGAASLVIAGGGLRVWGQAQAGPVGTATRPDVAAVDHDRILAAAQRYLTVAPTPIPSLVCPRSPGSGHDYYSEAEGGAEGGKAPAEAFTAHRDAVLGLGLQVGALAAGQLITGDARFGEHAALLLRVWFVDAATRMSPRMDYGQVVIGAVKEQPTMRDNVAMGTTVDANARLGGSFEGILETLPLVEVAQAVPFLVASGALGEGDAKGVLGWFKEYLRWLTEAQDSGARLAALARDRKDHHGTSWLLQVSAYSLLTAPENGGPKNEDKSMTELRHRFRTVTLRAQITAEGKFPRELSTDAPYRNSLFNLDMLAGICLLLSTRFESVWEYALEDGPGMRAAIAYHFPFIGDRAKWPYRADAAHFNELPSRRESLLLAAHVYQRPEYAALWKTLAPDPASAEVLRTIPIHQPILWVRQPPRTG